MTSRTKMMEATRGRCIIMILFLEEKSQRKLVSNNMTKTIVIGAVTDDVTDHSDPPPMRTVIIVITIARGINGGKVARNTGTTNGIGQNLKKRREIILITIMTKMIERS